MEVLEVITTRIVKNCPRNKINVDIRMCYGCYYYNGQVHNNIVCSFKEKKGGKPI